MAKFTEARAINLGKLAARDGLGMMGLARLLAEKGCPDEFENAAVRAMGQERDRMDSAKRNFA